MKLKNLPVKPSIDGDDIVIPTYVNELNSLTNPDQIKTFVDRWKEVFDGQYQVEHDILNGNYNPDEVVQCLNELKNGGECKHVGKTDCVGINLKLPPSFLKASLIAHKYMVPVDIVLIQANGGFGELDDF